MSLQQLPLNVQLRDEASFANFTVGENTTLVYTLQHIISGDAPQTIFYCWGAAGLGKSHLLHACCNAAAEKNQLVAYIPLSQSIDFTPEILDGLEQYDLIALDDIDAIAKQSAWEEKIFHLFNQVRDLQKKLFITGNQSPNQIDIILPDLRSRLAWGLVFQLLPLSDEKKIFTIIARAKQRGIDLPEEVARYLVQRVQRDMPSLMEILERLDKASISYQRRLTIPFLKQTLIDNLS